MKAAALKQSIEMGVFEGLSSIALGKLLDEVVVIDDYTFEARLTVRWAQFLNVLAGPAGYAMAPSMMNSPDKGVSDPVGTGPYSFETWVPDKSLKVERVRRLLGWAVRARRTLSRTSSTSATRPACPSARRTGRTSTPWSSVRSRTRCQRPMRSSPVTST